jgi:flavin-binding protein dodecin
MAEHIYKIEEFVGSSPDGQDAAVRNAVAAAGQVHSKVRWFEVKETRGQIVDGKVAHWQVTVRVGFAVE